MMPPANLGTVPLLAASDAFDVPVVLNLTRRPVRPLPRRPSAAAIDAGNGVWTSGTLPRRSGIYQVPTSWLDVLTSAISVGRDLRLWLAAAPSLALAELIARIYPLQAYLSLAAGTASARVIANPVYTVGTERSAKAAVGYRLGMTMADWLCRGPLGLGPTFHAETTSPNGAGTGWWAKTGFQPDLVCRHLSAQPWLVEAKGGGRVSRAALVKGSNQLNAPKLMAGPHRRVLTGASLRHRLHLTVDVDIPAGPSPSSPETSGQNPDDPEFLPPVEEDEAAWLLARSQLLVYYALIALPEQLRHVTVVDRGAIQDASRWTPRRVQRSDAVQDIASLYDQSGNYPTQPMITGTVPGTTVTVGMSPRLFAACGTLAAHYGQVADESDTSDYVTTADDITSADDTVAERHVRRQRQTFSDLARALEHRAQEAVAATFDRMESASLADVLRGRTAGGIRRPSPDVVIEGATAETYLSIDRSAVLVTAAQA